MGTWAGAPSYLQFGRRSGMGMGPDGLRMLDIQISMTDALGHLSNIMVADTTPCTREQWHRSIF